MSASAHKRQLERAYFHCIRGLDFVKVGTGLRISGYPIILHPAHGVFEPAAAFIREQAVWRSQESGSLEDLARIICIWCNYLQHRNVLWNEPEEHHYHQWLSNALRAGEIARSRQARWASVIMRWYHFLACRNVGGPLLRSFAASISASPLNVEILEPKARFKAPRGPKLKHGKRPVPDEDEVARVLQALMNHRDCFIAERNWLLGRTAYETGLRVMGIAALNCEMLNTMLQGDSLIAPSERVELLARDRAGKARIREGIHQLERIGRENLIACITEKGRKSRQVAFPLPLVLSLLEHVWGERDRFLRASGGSSRTRRSGGLWLSEKREGPLARNSIKEIVRNLGFAAARVRGSIHSLRAAFLTQYACRLLWEAKAKFGQNYDTRGILLMLAEIAGHECPDTLKHYLDEAQIREALMGEKAFLHHT